MYKLKVRKIGNSLGFTLPKEALAELDVGEGDELCLTKIKDGLLVTPYNEKFERAMEIMAEGSKQYRNALRELAK
jgi:putative addiction module antidote